MSAIEDHTAATQRDFNEHYRKKVGKTLPFIYTHASSTLKSFS